MVNGTLRAVMTPKIERSNNYELTAAKPVVAPANRNLTINIFLSSSVSGHHIFSSSWSMLSLNYFFSLLRIRRYIMMIDRKPLTKIMFRASVCDAILIRSVFKGFVSELTKE